MTTSPRLVRVAVALLGAALTGVACGDDDDDEAAGGSSGHAGQTAGTSGQAGASAAQGGAAGSLAAGSAGQTTGGQAGLSGSSGHGGASGAGASGAGAGGGGGGGAGAATCPHVLCEDFEASASLAPSWVVSKDAADALVEVQSTQVAHGKNAVHFHVAAKGRAATIADTAAVAKLPDHVFGRAYYRLEPNSSAGHTDFFLAHAGDSGRLEIGEYLDNWQITYQWPGGEGPVAPPGLPANKWVCVTWEFQRTPSPRIALQVDGKSIGDVTYTEFNNSPVPAITSPFTDLTFGVNQYGDRADGTAIDVYMDDLALDSAAIPCLP